jgi:DUF4097 and DUF4098 domain-containing protein YvlB
MNRTAIAILAALGTSLAASAQAEEVNESQAAAPDGHVEISNIAGSVDIIGWSRDSVEVTGELGKNVEELIFEREGDRVTVKVKVPKKNNRSISTDLVIRVPEKSSIDVGTVSADIDVEDVLGEQRLHTVSGDVEAVVAGSDCSFESVSGDIEVEGDRQDSDIRAGSVSGDVTLFRIAGEVRAETVTGDLIIDEGSFDRVNLETVNGEILFQSVLRKGGRMNAEAVNGDIDVEFTDDISAEFDLSSFNGSIDNCFGPEAKRTSKYAPGWGLRFTEGDGDGRVSMSTLNGDMSLCKK